MSRNPYSLDGTFIDKLSLYKDKSLYIYKDLEISKEKAVANFQSCHMDAFGDLITKDEAEQNLDQIIALIVECSSHKI